MGTSGLYTKTLRDKEAKEILPQEPTTCGQHQWFSSAGKAQHGMSPAIFSVILPGSVAWLSALSSEGWGRRVEGRLISWLCPHTENRMKNLHAPLRCYSSLLCTTWAPCPCPRHLGIRAEMENVWWELDLEVTLAFRFGEARLCKILQVPLNINGTGCFLWSYTTFTGPLTILLFLSLDEQPAIHLKGRKPPLLYFKN